MNGWWKSIIFVYVETDMGILDYPDALYWDSFENGMEPREMARDVRIENLYFGFPPSLL